MTASVSGETSGVCASFGFVEWLWFAAGFCPALFLVFRDLLIGVPPVDHGFRAPKNPARIINPPEPQRPRFLACSVRLQIGKEVTKLIGMVTKRLQSYGTLFFAPRQALISCSADKIPHFVKQALWRTACQNGSKDCALLPFWQNNPNLPPQYSAPSQSVQAPPNRNL